MTTSIPAMTPKQVQQEIKAISKAAAKVMASKASAVKFLDSIRVAQPSPHAVRAKSR